MSYNDNDRQRYEDWHKEGTARGWFNRAADEIRSWFEPPSRQHMDQERHWRHVEGGQGTGDYGNQAGRPDWQRRYYSGPSPRGSRTDEYGRYDEPRYQPSSREDLRRYDRNRHQYGEPYEQGYEYQGEPVSTYGSRFYGGSGERPWGNEYYPPFRGSWRDVEERRHRAGYGSMQGQQYGEGGEYYGTTGQWGDRDLENRWGGRHRQWFGQPRQERGMIGSHRGRGPRNYQRSDERIQDEINEFYTLHPELDATDIDVNVNNGVVTLKGRVDDRQDKRLAEEIAEDVYGVKEVHNELRYNQIGQQNQTQTPAGLASGQR